jgi:primosomal protein N' (replication factor Y) (superfamily II helicase)
MQKIAKLAIQSNLPQLDRLFDYAIPETLQDVAKIGSRVRVIFGRSKRPLDAFIVEFPTDSEFRGRLSEVLEVVGNAQTLQPNVFRLCQQLAERSATTLGELLKLAIPAHMPRSFAAHASSSQVNKSMQTFSIGDLNGELEPLVVTNNKSFVLVEPRAVETNWSGAQFSAPAWVKLFTELALRNLAQSKSTIILVPDYREHEQVLHGLMQAGCIDFVVNFSQEQPKSKQYEAFLHALESNPKIVLGSRSAAFAPAHNLGSILVFDEADRSYSDQAAPYLNSRDVVLVRQAIESCSLVFVSHSISSDIKRLLDANFLTDRTQPFVAPRVSNSEPGLRVDSHAYSAIKLGLDSGPVLVQVASVGDSTAIYCKACEEPARCSDCKGPLWLDSTGSKKCRWCNAFLLDYKCSCGGSEIVLGRAGSTRTAAELGRAFPSARVVESTGVARTVSIARGKTLVVATAGAEPYVEGGYSAVVLLDAKIALSRQNLRSQEEAVRIWSNAVAKASFKAPCVLVGVSGELSQLFCLWNHEKIAENEYQSRQELKLPPAVRLGSITAELELLTELSDVLSHQDGVIRIGPAPLEGSSKEVLWRLIFKYPYSIGVELAKTLKVEVARVSAGRSRTVSSGRSARAITVKMNDPEVI